MSELFDLSGKVALITGSSKGIGRAIAERMAEHGAKVVVSSRKADICAEVVAGIVEKGGEAISVPCNINEKEQLQHLVDETKKAFGQIDIVVCNAGIVRTKYFGDYDDNDWHTLMGVHLHGAFTVVRAAWPHFKEQDHGRIVLTGSSAGLYGQNLQAGCKTAAPAAAAAASGS